MIRHTVAFRLKHPAGFFFSSIFHAIDNFVGGLFKAALRIRLIRAVIQIAAFRYG